MKATILVKIEIDDTAAKTTINAETIENMDPSLLTQIIKIADNTKTRVDSITKPFFDTIVPKNNEEETEQPETSESEDENTNANE